MSKSRRGIAKLTFLLSLLLAIVTPEARAQEPTLEFHSTDKSFTMTTVDDFRVTYNPHAVMSLANLDDVAVVVTKRKAESTIEEIFDNYPKSMPKDQPVMGRMMITVDGQQAVAFVVEGMFPPQGEATHQTLLTIALHDGQEYDFMIHYPLEHEKQGLEDAYAMMGKVKWAPPVPPESDTKSGAQTPAKRPRTGQSRPRATLRSAG